ncbi:helix-turn-helix and ligand-binding sensor domain-containing protein [Sediminicola luteus]|uniref:helix-turn-helix and ligand-binding sensor domain-containing protein n=1 Tax=Sediminicola luteus TaxID=319238 RepID=UPI001C0EC72E|nr:triple tyrosine motif-containing protein [Sediminicola luteus]
MGISFFLGGQELPPIINYAPNEYGAENQNWAIAQSLDKRIFVANNKGLLEYNGAQWHLYPSPNETLMRSVWVEGPRVYTGCYMEFGYWERDLTGQLKYTSIAKKVKNGLKTDEEFWNILEIDGHIVFQSFDRLYTFNPATEEIRITESEEKISKIFKVNGSLWLQRMGQGIFQMTGGVQTPKETHDWVKDYEVVGIFPFAGGIRYLIKQLGFVQTSPKGLETCFLSVQNELSQALIYSGIHVRGGGYLVGTVRQGAYLIDEDGDVVHKINRKTALANNTVLSVFEGVSGGIWLGLDNGIGYYELQSAFSIFKDNQGNLGSVYAARPWQGNLYLGTNQGLFYRKLDTRDAFSFVPGTQGQVWFLDEVEGQLVCGHHNGTYLIDGGKAEHITRTAGSWKIMAVPNSPGLWLEGSYTGLKVLERKNDLWQVRNKIDGFDLSSRYFELYDGHIWVNHEYKGLFKLQISDDFSSVLENRAYTELANADSGLALYNDSLLYHAKSGLHVYDKKSGGFKMNEPFQSEFQEDTYISGKMISDRKAGALWLFGEQNLYRLRQGTTAEIPEITKIPLSEAFRNGIVGYESLVSIQAENQYLMGSRSGFVIMNSDKLEVKDFQVYIDRVYLLNDSKDVSKGETISKKGFTSLSWDKNNIGFTFYSPDYRKIPEAQYGYRLKGSFDNWSDWTTNSSVTFENLSPGKYQFELRAKIGNRVSTNTATMDFEIHPPWYAARIMFLIYGLMALVLARFIHQTYKGYYRKKQEQLIERNKRELDLIKAKNEKELIQMRNAKLREDFKGKSKELAASTLNMVRKNELLQKIRDELRSSNLTQEGIRSLLNIIETDLGRGDDWEMFKEAFDNVDREFLGKLQAKHPKLSPNDIRLCAYLRLNLSSKEIAPLFNISTRSVEIKRYRLRKKMQLDRDENLVKYIMDL